MNEHAGHRQRLRETYLKKGVEGMADHQVLELLLTYAQPRGDVNPLAHRLLDRFDSLEGVLTARPEELTQVQGVGEQIAVFLSLIGEVDRRTLLQRLSGGQKRQSILSTPAALGGYMLALSLQDRYETLRVLCLNRKFGLIHQAVVASGSLTEVLADPRPILETAIAHKACFLAVAHNHPSGDVTPSREDEAAAARIEAAAETVGIGVVDQLILGRGAVYSLRSGRVLVFSGTDLVMDQTLDAYRETLVTSSSLAEPAGQTDTRI